MFVPETQVDAHERSDDEMSIDEYPVTQFYPACRSRSWIPTVATRSNSSWMGLGSRHRREHRFLRAEPAVHGGHSTSASPRRQVWATPVRGDE